MDAYECFPSSTTKATQQSQRRGNTISSSDGHRAFSLLHLLFSPAFVIELIRFTFFGCCCFRGVSFSFQRPPTLQPFHNPCAKRLSSRRARAARDHTLIHPPSWRPPSTRPRRGSTLRPISENEMSLRPMAAMSCPRTWPISWMRRRSRRYARMWMRLRRKEMSSVTDIYRQIPSSRHSTTTNSSSRPSSSQPCPSSHECGRLASPTS